MRLSTNSIRQDSKELSELSAPSSPRCPVEACRCRSCHKFYMELECEIVRLNTLTASLVDKFGPINGTQAANPHSSAPIQSMSSMQSVMDCQHLASEQLGGASVSPALVSPKVDVGRRARSNSDDEAMIQMTRSQMVKSSFVEHEQSTVLQLPRALVERNVIGVELSVRSFAPQDVGQRPQKGIVPQRPASAEVLPDKQRRSNSLRPNVKKLKLHALWEEAYAMADEDLDFVPMGTTTSNKFWQLGSIRTGMLAEPPEWTKFRKNLANPHSHMHLMWDCLALLLISYDLAMIPIEVAWDLPRDAKGTPIWFVSLEIAYWTIDMQLSLFRGFYDKGMLVWDTAKIRLRYLRSWFIFDFLLIVVDCMVVFSRTAGATGLVRLTMWVRLIRMWRAVKMTFTARKLEEACGNLGMPSASLVHAVVYTFAMISLLTHMIACAWYFIGRRGVSAGEENWLEEAEVEGEPMNVEYLLCFHWVLGQFTPAPVKIAPVNPEERLFTIIVIFFTLFVLGKGYQKMSHTLQELNASRHESNRMRRSLQHFLVMHKVPLELAVRTTRFADHVLTRKTQVQLDDSLVSEHLRRELTMHQRQGYLVDHPLFSLLQQGYPDAISNICEALYQNSYDKGRAIYTCGSIARCLYITTQGTFHIEMDSWTDYITNVQYLAEVSLYAHVMHTSTLHAITFGDAFTFAAADFKRCVHGDPGCSKLVLEYANALLGILRRDPDSVHDVMNPASVTSAVAATKCYRMLHVDTDAVMAPRSDREVASFSSVDSDRQQTAALVIDFLKRLKAGQVEDKDVAVELEQVFPELDPELGVYAKTLYQDERLRTVLSMVNTLWLWTNNYEAFVNPQRQHCRLSPEVWRKLQLFVRWVDPSMELMHAILVMIAIRGIGNIAPLVKELPKANQRTCKAVSYIMRDSRRRFVQHIPSADALPEEYQNMVTDAFDIHDVFNLGQFMEGENLPFNIQQLQEIITFRNNGDTLFKLYLLAIVGVMSGRDMRTDLGLSNPHLDMIPGSRFIDERRGKMIMSCLEVLEHLTSALPQTIYWSYMSWNAVELNLDVSTAPQLALARLMCLSRSFTETDVYQLRLAWENLPSIDRQMLTDCLVADGIIQRSVRFSYLPLCLANARGNPCVGLLQFLRILAELLDVVRAHGCWGQTEAMTLTLDLQDLASFIVAVNNMDVFATCLLRAELRQLDSRVTVVMTSRNWLRATDTDNHEVAVVASIHNVYQKQRAIEFAMEFGGHFGGADGVGHADLAIADSFHSPRPARDSADLGDADAVMFEQDV